MMDLPPPGKPGRKATAYAKHAAAMRREPGMWTLLDTFASSRDAAQRASRIRRGKYPRINPDTHEVVARTYTAHTASGRERTVHAVFARYVEAP